MITRCRRDVPEALGLSRYGANRTLAIAVALSFMLGAGPRLASGDDDDNGGGSRSACSATATALFKACKASVTDDSFVKKAICVNISDATERAECVAELRSERTEGNKLCQEQRDGRRDACNSLGEGRYDPDFDPALFDNPKNPTHPNPYFPMTVGNRWEYRGGNEVNTVEVVNETKLISGVTCLVFRDQVFKDGDLAEDTDDWFCQAKDGNVWYFGEEVKDFDSFDGDDPRKPELVKIDGSFKAGRDGDKPGIIFQASPTVGQTYLEEFSLGNAEDVTEVLSTTYTFGTNAELDQFVPQQLAERFCSAGDCVVTKNFSLLEPGDFARKYYARGIGVFLEVKPDTGIDVQLVNCSFDSRCANLPQP